MLLRKVHILSYTVSLILLVLIGIKLYRYYGSNTNSNFDISKVEENHDIIIGNINGPIRIVMFGNYQCQFCVRFLQNELPILIDQYGNSLNFTLKVVPFSNSKKEQEALKMALAVSKYGNYDAYQSFLLRSTDIIYKDIFQDYLNTIMESNEMIANYFYSNQTSTIIEDNTELFKHMQIKGTPSFIINSNLKEGYLSSTKIISIIDNI